MNNDLDQSGGPPARRSRFGYFLLLSSLFAAAVAPIAGGADFFADSVPLRELAARSVRNDRIDPVWLENGTRLWFRTVTPDGASEFHLVDAATGEKKPLFDHAGLRAALGRSGLTAEAIRDLRLENVQPDVVARTLGFALAGKKWMWHDDRSELAPVDTPGAEALPPVPRASVSGGPDMNLSIRNETGGPVSLWWLDTTGRRQAYGRIPTGGTGDQHTFAGHVWLVTDSEGKDLTAFAAHIDRATVVVKGAEEIRWDGAPRERRRGPRRDQPDRDQASDRSPDGRFSAFIRDHNLFVKSGEGAETPLTTDGTEADKYEGPFFWSPDSTRLAALRHRTVQERRVSAVRSSPADQLQPKIESWDYAKPGDPLPFRRPRLFDVAASTQLPVDEQLFATPYSIDEFHWAPDSSAFHFLYNERGHQLLRLVALDRDGRARALLDERSDTFVDYSQKTYLHWLDTSGEFLWMSERSGWNHLYLCEAGTGSIKNAVTTGTWAVRGVDRVDPENRQLDIRCHGLQPAQDPGHLHFARVNFDGTGFTKLTASDGTHTIDFAPDRKSHVATWSRVDHPPVHELRRTADGSLLCELNRADHSALVAAGWPAPERFTAPGRDGTTPIYGYILRPWKFDAAKTYPVIESIYAGPHDFHVRKEFRAWDRHSNLGNLGFVLVFIDGMGTNWRSRTFHDIAWKNIGDAGFPDRVAWIKAAAATRPWMDLTRVGIYGGSAGGQNAMRALIAHGDFYHAAAADCGCHDNRMDKIWWNEAWMGYPIGDHYLESSNVVQAHRLRGHLLLTVGEVDTNVDPASTMQVVNALIKADKTFELLVVPNSNHGAGESPYASKRRAQFFQRHLLGQQPAAN